MLALFYREFASLISSGVSVIDGMAMLAEHAGSSRLREITFKIKEDAAQGISLGEAFAKFPDVFPEWQASIIKYSEKSGRLSQGFESLAAYLERDYSLQLGIITGLAYPVFLLHAAIFLLPLVNLFTCGGSAKYLRGVLAIILPLYGFPFLLFSFLRILNKPQLKTGFHIFLINIPLLGQLLRRIAVSRFILALHSLCSSGVPIISAWKIASEATGNETVKARIFKAAPFLEEGGQLSEAFIKSGLCDYRMAGLVKSAEKSGNLVEALEMIYKYSDKEINTAVGLIARILPVVIYLLVAAFIGSRVISFYLGYFRSNYLF